MASRVRDPGGARRQTPRSPVPPAIYDALDKLTSAQPSGDVIKLTGREEWRLRVGDWRVLFQRDSEDRVIRVLRVLPRGRAYRD